MEQFEDGPMSAMRCSLARLIRGAALLASLVLPVAPIGAVAQLCAGDCNGDDSVEVSELVVGINIATDQQSLANCPALDVTGNGAVSITELVLAVRKALSDCLPICGDYMVDEGEECDDGGNTDADGCQGNCRLPLCGDGIVDLIIGETCDDGNTDEGTGDSCPPDCRIESCTPSRNTIVATVEFATNPGDLLITGLTLFVRYPDGVVGIPGSSNDASVLARVSSPSFSVTPNDQNYGLSTVLLDPTFSGVAAGTAISIEFDTCDGADAPSTDDFQCSVEDAADSALNPVRDQVSCSVSLP